MPLVIYNSLSRKKEIFQSLRPGEASVYLCGPTVYGLLHVGNFRGATFFNLLRHWMRRQGYAVRMAYNFTDVDDKIIERARQEGVAPHVVSERYIAEFKRDFKALGLEEHDFNPKVTDSIDAIIGSIERLLAGGHAYVVDGEVLFAVRSFGAYGRLSGRNPDELMAGARVEVNAKKRDPLDFALWKPAADGETGWPSPWGRGRPGWHIECTAMIQRLFGDQIDIHGGGTDLIFPHHENEIAQGEGCSHKTYARYWVHNNMFTFGGQKMSKSLGNLLTMREFLEQNHPEIYKFLVLSVHYRSLAEFSDETLHSALLGVARVYSALALARHVISGGGEESPDPAFAALLKQADTAIADALNDDFSTPQVFAEVFGAVRAFNQRVKRGAPATGASRFCARAFVDWTQGWGRLMALFQEPPEGFLRRLDDALLNQRQVTREEIDDLVAQRQQARGARDFARADALRAQLANKGVEVQDLPGGNVHWEARK